MVAAASASGSGPGNPGTRVPSASAQIRVGRNGREGGIVKTRGITMSSRAGQDRGLRLGGLQLMLQGFLAHSRSGRHPGRRAERPATPHKCPRTAIRASPVGPLQSAHRSTAARLPEPPITNMLSDDVPDVVVSFTRIETQ
jgi:hypothetical protein